MYDVQKWLNENLNALNMTDEQKAVAQQLASGDFGKRLGASVYPQEAVSGLQSALDRQKSTQAELESANIAWQDQYYRDLSELGAVDRLAAAGFDTTGLVANRQGGVTNQQGQTFTLAEVQALVQRESKAAATAAIDPVRQSNLEYAEFLADAREDYRQMTGKRFDSKAFREYAFENRDKFRDVPQAYEAYTADARKEKADADRAKWETEKEKEIEMRVMSRMNIPEMSPESGQGGPFDIANNAIDKAAASGVADAPVPSVPREVNRQEFARKFRELNLQGL